ncbi:MAG TPA: hypothetical protein VI122_20270 [Thermoleophilaceae bacterium]|jgi:hypothetical protein
MSIRPILLLLMACAALFGISFAVGGLLKQGEEGVTPTSAKSTSPEIAEEPPLAIGRAAGLPDLRSRPRKPDEPGYAAATVAPSPPSAAPAPAQEASAEPAPSTEPAAPVEQQAPVTPPPPRSSAPDSPPAGPAPDAAPSQPSPSPDPYASGGSGFYDDGG